jgi:large subunit ribosomal protein L25
MKTFELAGIVREGIGKKAARKIRKEKNVPCVLYGGEKTFHFYTSERNFTGLLFTPNVYIVKLTIGTANYDALIKDVQFDPVSDEVLHADFLQIFEDKKAYMEIPLYLNGFAKGVKEGGFLQQPLRKLKVRAFPKDLPDIIEIDVENLGIGEAVRIENLSVPNVEFLNSKMSVVATVKVTRAAKDATEETSSSTAAPAAGAPAA